MNNLIYEKHNMPEKYFPFIMKSQTLTNSKVSNNWHKNPEFLYCFSGHGYVSCGREQLDFRPGVTAIINPNVLHTVWTSSSVSYWWLIVDCSFFENNGLNIDAYPFCSRVEDDTLSELYVKICRLYFGDRTPLNIAETRAAVINFITDMCKHHTLSESAESQKPVSKTNETVKEVIEYINTHFSEKISLDSIAKQIHLSKYHFARIFHDCTGSTVTDQINIRRCEEAKNLIATSETSISEIATICGFENASYFSKVFKKHFGIKPSDIPRR